MSYIKWHNSPIVSSDTEPSAELFFPYYEDDWKWHNTTNNRWYDRQGGQWIMQGSPPEDYALVDHTHSDLEDIVALLNQGITGSKTIGNYRFTFNHGVLVGFEEV